MGDKIECSGCGEAVDRSDASERFMSYTIKGVSGEKDIRGYLCGLCVTKFRDLIYETNKEIK